MPQKLTDAQIETVCREVLATEPAPSGRSLRRALRARYGAVARTARVFATWNRLTRGVVDEVADPEREQWRARVRAAEERASLAEERERVHQDRWASEVYELRAALALSRGAGQAPSLVHQRYHEALVKIQELERELARFRGSAIS